MNLLIDGRGVSIGRVDAIAAQYLDDPVIFTTQFNGKDDVLVAHEILDSNNACFIGFDIDKCNCPDLVARALLTTRSIFLTNETNKLQKYLPNYSFRLDAERVAFPEVNVGPGNGNWKKDVYLLVGERPGNAESLGKKDAAFFSVAASSKWLREQLMSLTHFTPENFYFVNAYDRQDVQTDWGFIEKLHPRKIFTLGNYAHGALAKANIKHVEVAHPQSWKRFHSKKEYPLITHLKQETHEDQFERREQA